MKKTDDNSVYAKFGGSSDKASEEHILSYANPISLCLLNEVELHALWRSANEMERIVVQGDILEVIL